MRVAIVSVIIAGERFTARVHEVDLDAVLDELHQKDFLASWSWEGDT